MQYVSVSICVHKHITYYFRVEIWIFSRFLWPACGTDVKVLRLLPTRYGLMWKESVNALPKVVGFLSHVFDRQLSSTNSMKTDKTTNYLISNLSVFIGLSKSCRQGKIWHEVGHNRISCTGPSHIILWTVPYDINLSNFWYRGNKYSSLFSLFCVWNIVLFILSLTFRELYPITTTAGAYSFNNKAVSNCLILMRFDNAIVLI